MSPDGEGPFVRLEEALSRCNRKLVGANIVVNLLMSKRCRGAPWRRLMLHKFRLSFQNFPPTFAEQQAWTLREPN